MLMVMLMLVTMGRCLLFTDIESRKLESHARFCQSEFEKVKE